LQYDPFLAELVKLSKAFNEFAQSDEVEKQKLVQTVHMCVLRCDFMIDVPSNSVKLVEYNTIASGMGCLSEKVRGVQSYIKDKYGD